MSTRRARAVSPSPAPRCGGRNAGRGRRVAPEPGGTGREPAPTAAGLAHLGARDVTRVPRCAPPGGNRMRTRAARPNDRSSREKPPAAGTRIGGGTGPYGPRVRGRDRARRRSRRPPAVQDAGAARPHGHRHRRDRRGGHLRADRHGGDAVRRTGHHGVVRADRDRPRLRRPVLRRVGGDAVLPADDGGPAARHVVALDRVAAGRASDPLPV